LVVIAHNAEVLPLLGEHGDKSVLSRVCILIFVHHYVVEPVLVFSQNIGEFSK
jgi:hypothetical protein